MSRLAVRLALVWALLAICLGLAGCRPARRSTRPVSTSETRKDAGDSSSRKSVLVAGEPKTFPAFAELDDFLARQKSTEARVRYLKGRFEQTISHAKKISTEAEQVGAAPVLDRLKQVIAELLVLASLAFDGYQRDDLKTRLAVPLSNLSTWLSQLEKKGLLRRQVLLQEIRSGQLPDADLFYFPPQSFSATNKEVLVVPSLASLAKQLPARNRYQVELAHFVNRNSITAMEKEVQLLEAELEALEQEARQVSAAGQKVYAHLQKTLTNLLRLTRQNLEMQRAGAKLFDRLLEDFLAESAHVQADDGLDRKAKNVLGDEMDRALDTIRQMRRIARGESASGIIADNGELHFVMIGGRRFRDFDDGMRAWGVRFLPNGIVGFGKLDAVPDPGKKGKPNAAGREVQVLGLKSLQALRKHLQGR
jgi:hypothetical protein